MQKGFERERRKRKAREGNLWSSTYTTFSELLSVNGRSEVQAPGVISHWILPINKTFGCLSNASSYKNRGACLEVINGWLSSHVSPGCTSRTSRILSTWLLYAVMWKTHSGESWMQVMLTGTRSSETCCHFTWPAPLAATWNTSAHNLNTLLIFKTKPQKAGSGYKKRKKRDNGRKKEYVQKKEKFRFVNAKTDTVNGK